MKNLLLDDAENAQGCGQCRHSGRNGRVRNVHAVAIEMELLLIDRDKNLDWTLRNIAERLFTDVPGHHLRRFVLLPRTDRRYSERKQRCQAERAGTAEQRSLSLRGDNENVPRLSATQGLAPARGITRIARRILLDTLLSGHNAT